jgi:hypothetical protein
MKFLKSDIAKIALFVGLGGFAYWKIANSKRFAKWYIEKSYGSTVARYVTAIYKIESGNFKSNIFKRTRGAGVLAFKKYKPYGHKERMFKGVFTYGTFASSNGLSYVIFATLLDGYKFVANYLTYSGSELAKIEARVKMYGSQNADYLNTVKKYV